MSNLTQEEWVEQLAQDSNALVLDVRTLEEVQGGIIQNAIHIDFYQGHGFIEKMQDLDKSKNYYVYCRSGNRSGQACNIMSQMGFENAFNLIGGMLEWEGDVVQP